MATTFTDSTATPKVICRVKALYSFSSTEKSSLSFGKDEYIDVLSQLDSGWWDGWCKGNRGWFPSNYVQVIEVNPNVTKEMTNNHNKDAMRRESINPPPQQHLMQTQQQQHLARPQSLALSESSNERKSGSLRRVNMQQKTMEEEDEGVALDLPKGWTLQLAEDGMTKFYFNQKTGGLRWSRPGTSDSEEDEYIDEDDSSSSNEDYSIGNRNNYPYGRHPLVNFDDYNDFGGKPPSLPGKQPTTLNGPSSDNSNLMSCWIEKTTPQGKVYYGNSVTHETTWNYDDIDPATGRLKNNNENQPDNNTEEESLCVDPGLEKSSLLLSGSDETPITWKTTALEIAHAVQKLNTAIGHGEPSSTIKTRVSIVVNSVRLMLYSSRSIDKDAPHLKEADSREPHRNVLSSLAKLVLSAKVVNDANPEASIKVQRDAKDVLNAVRKFILVCQSKNVTIEPVNPKLLLNIQVSLSSTTNSLASTSESNNGSATASISSATGQQEDLITMSASAKRKSGIITGNVKANKYQLNQDLIVSLQTHAKQIVGSTDTLCKAAIYIYTITSKEEQGKEDPLKAEAKSKEESESSLVKDETKANKPPTDQWAQSEVVLSFQKLSSQVGSYFAILNDIDMTSHIDNIPSYTSSLAEFRSNKQCLYNSFGLLFSAVQVLTDPHNDLITSINNIEQSVKSVEDAIEGIFSTIVQMVGERKIWLMRNDADNDINGPKSPVHAYFEIDKKSIRQQLGGSNADEKDTSMLTRLYNRQNSSTSTVVPNHQMSQHRPSISQSNSGTGVNKSTLKRQFSFGNQQQQGDLDDDLWYLGYDYAEGDIEFTTDNHIKGGTLRALVERLTLHDYIDMSYIENFLLTYRSFCTTEEFVELLQERYNLIPPEGLTPDKLEIWTDKKQKLVRLRVFNVMKNWLENYYDDEDELILNKLQLFANTVICDSSSFSAEQLNRLIRKRRDGGGLKRLIPNATNGPVPIIPKNIKNMQLTDVDPLELSRQLTVIDYKLYSTIQPIECLGKSWSDEGSTGVKESINYSNRLASWVTGCILGYKEAKKRAIVIKYWSQVASRCLELNNYNTCMAILSVFENSAVGRLKKTWELVGSRTTQSLNHIRKIMGFNRNFTEYREMLHSVNPPCIPFLGIYLQDLTFIEDGNPDMLKKSSNLINFAKQQKSAEVIREIKQFQSPPYIFQEVPEIQEFIRESLEKNEDVDTLYERSLEVEPKPATNTLALENLT